MVPNLEVKDLLLVRALVEEGGATKAGARLHLSQSAVSHHLRRIEERLGVELFVRSGKKMIAKAEAKRLVIASQPILEAMVELEQQVLGGGERMQRIRLSTECYTCYHWLPPLLEEFERKHPDTEVSIVMEATRQPLEAMGRGELDVAIAHSRAVGRGWVTTPLFEDPWVVVVPPDHPLATSRKIAAADLRAETLIIHDAPSRDLARIGAEMFGRARGSTPRVVRVPLTEAIVELVKAGRGVSILARWAIRPALESGDLVARPFAGKGIVRKWNAIHRRGSGTPIPALVDLLSAALSGGALVKK
jgi:LysR family transcriptional regulator for metE and metH